MPTPTARPTRHPLPRGTWGEIKAESLTLKPDLSPAEREEWVLQQYNERLLAQDTGLSRASTIFPAPGDEVSETETVGARR